MRGIEQNILKALLELEAAVKAMATANPKPDLRPLFGRIDKLSRELPCDSDPTLLHYLHKKSIGCKARGGRPSGGANRRRRGHRHAP